MLFHKAVVHMAYRRNRMLKYSAARSTEEGKLNRVLTAFSYPFLAFVLLIVCATAYPMETIPNDLLPRDIVIPGPNEMGPDVLWPYPGYSTTPPEDPQVGDSWLWWLWVGETWPPNFEQAMCTVRGIGERCYVVVKDDEWLVNIDQADVDIIIDSWENWSVGSFPDLGIYELDSLAFGAPPDELDGDPRIYLLYYNVGSVAAGFFFMFDEYPEGTYPNYHSNECEVCYLNPVSPGGPSGEMMLAVAAHEFQHMIHWLYDYNEASWVNEGMAGLAMWLYGYPDPIYGFNSNPDNNLIDWNGEWSDYVQTYLWSLYFYERYGGLPAVYAVVHEPANSIAGYENVLDSFGHPQNFEDVFGDWIVANYLDDMAIEDGRFGYIGIDLPSFALSGTYSSYPVTDVSMTVNHWAADYCKFTGFGSSSSILLSFNGADNNKYKVWGLAIRSDGTTEVLPMIIDEETQSGSLWIGGLTDTADQVILVVGAASNTGALEYSFSASTGTGIESAPEPPGVIAISASPNPFSSSVSIHLHLTGEAAGDRRMDIYDITGRLVRSFDLEEQAGEIENVVWDCTSQDGSPCPTGVYMVRAGYGMSTGGSSLMLLRGSELH